MRQEYYQDRIYGFDEYEILMILKKAEKRSRKDENGQNGQKQGQNGLFRVAFE